MIQPNKGEAQVSSGMKTGGDLFLLDLVIRQGGQKRYIIVESVGLETGINELNLTSALVKL